MVRLIIIDRPQKVEGRSMIRRLQNEPSKKTANFFHGYRYVLLDTKGHRDVPPAVDWTVAKELLGSSEDVLREFSDLVKKEAPTLVADIRRGIETRDSKLLCRAAHTLKSTVNYFGAAPLAETASALENLGRVESFEGAPQMLATLEVQLARVLVALDVGPIDS